MAAAARRAALQWVAALGLVLGVGLLFVAPARAAGACSYTINGQDLDTADGPERAITIAGDQDLAVTASGPAPLGQVRIQAAFWPLSVQVYEPPPTTESSWTGTVNLAQQNVVVQGLYQLTIDDDIAECPPSTGWVNVAGGNPLATVPGVIGAGVAVAGVAIFLVAVRGALSGAGGGWLGALGGVMAGLGALVVAQQAGAAPIDARSVTVWAGLPGVAGSTVTRAISGRRRGAGAASSAEAPEEDAVSGGGGGPVAEAPPGAVPPPPPPPAPSAPPPPTAAEVVPPTAAEPPATATAAPPPPTAVESPPTAAEPPAPTAAEPAGDAAEPPPPTAAEPAGVGAGSTGSADPPRTSYAKLDAPDAVVGEKTFDVTVGLASAPDTDLDAAPLVRPAWSRGSYVLTIQLLADGFERVDAADDPWRIDLDVTADQPYPEHVVQLRADAADRPIRGRQIRATYSVQGQVMGVATRQIAVVDNEVRLATLEPVAPRPPATLSTPRGEDAPDLTITIEHQEDESGGSFWLQMLTGDGTGVRPESRPLPVDLGSGAQAFLQGVIESVRANEGKASMGPSLVGIGRRIARQLPDPLWDAFGQVAKAVAPRPPSIQILSAEAYIPWELAVLPDAVAAVDPAVARFLGAQANVGRWVIGEPPPRVPPPARLDIRSIAVISGVFTGPSRLEQAEAEADALEATFDADTVQAVDEAVLACLTRQPPYDIVHFAVHGTYADPASAGAGAGAVSPKILLADGTFLDENAVMGLEPMSGTPLVFLNACQVGSGHQVLGDYAGMAAAFLYAGAAAVVAPLWSIDDEAAREIGIRFYERVFAGASPAEALRLERASFLTSPETATSTFLAYQYYGHPSLKLDRDKP